MTSETNELDSVDKVLDAYFDSIEQGGDEPTFDRLNPKERAEVERLISSLEAGRGINPYASRPSLAALLAYEPKTPSLTDVVHVADKLQTGLRDRIDEYCTVVPDLGALAYNIPSDLYISCRGHRLRAIIDTDTAEIDALTKSHISAVASIFGAFNDTAGVLLLTCPSAFSGVVIERADLVAAIEVPRGDCISARIRRPVSDAVTACCDFVRELAPTFEPLDPDGILLIGGGAESPDIKALVNSSVAAIVNQGTRAKIPEKRAAWTALGEAEITALVDVVSDLESGDKSPDQLHNWLDSVVLVDLP